MGDYPANIVAEWPQVIAFTPLNPVSQNHTLIVPKQHVENAIDNPVVTTETMYRASQFAAQFSASNILISNGKAATQSIMHLHIHVVERAFGDQLMLPWGTTGDPHLAHTCKISEFYKERLRILQDCLDVTRNK